MKLVLVATSASALLAAATPTAAEVISSSPQGFAVESKVVVAAGPAEAYAMLGRIGRWWDPAHSYSGKGANLSLALKAGGCFCEEVPPDGTVEHMRVVQARPASMLRLHGGLGPLQGEGASGSLTWTLKAVPGGTEITQTYVVGGYIRMGGEKLAPMVDGVMSQQLDRLARALGTR